MLNLKRHDKVPCSEIRKGTKIIDIIEYTLKQKRKWAGHIAKMKYNRWTNAEQSDSQEEERDQGDDQVEDGNST